MYNFRKYAKSDKPYKYLTLSFDDGVTQDRRFLEIINRYGLKCTFNLNSGTLGMPGELHGKDWRVDHIKVAPEEVRDLYEGHEIAVHTVHHPRLDLLSQDEVFHEVEDDRIALEELSGQKIIGMAYPGGHYFNDDVINTIRTGTPIVYSRDVFSTYDFSLPENLMIWKPTVHMNDEKLFDISKRFIEEDFDEDTLLYVWGHTYEFDIYDSWDKVERFCEYISGRDDVTYATNGEIAEYILNNK